MSIVRIPPAAKAAVGSVLLVGLALAPGEEQKQTNRLARQAVQILLQACD